MGYVNHWNPKKLSKDQIPQQFWKDAKAILNHIIQEQDILLGDAFAEEEAQATDLIHVADNEPYIMFNGVSAEACDTFRLIFNGESNFCKTEKCPYDIAVKCILLLANKYHLLSEDERGYTWCFDGDVTDEEYVNAKRIMIELFPKYMELYAVLCDGNYKIFRSIESLKQFLIEDGMLTEEESKTFDIPTFNKQNFQGEQNSYFVSTINLN